MPAMFLVVTGNAWLPGWGQAGEGASGSAEHAMADPAGLSGGQDGAADGLRGPFCSAQPFAQPRHCTGVAHLQRLQQHCSWCCICLTSELDMQFPSLRRGSADFSFWHGGAQLQGMQMQLRVLGT